MTPPLSLNLAGTPAQNETVTRLSRGAEHLFEVLRWYFGKFKRVIPLQSKLAEHLKVTIRQVQRYVRELRLAGLIAVEKCGHQAAEYVFQAQAIERRNVGSESCLGRVYVALKSCLRPRHPYSLIGSVSVSSQSAAQQTEPRKTPQRAMTVMEAYAAKHGVVL